MPLKLTAVVRRVRKIKAMVEKEDEFFRWLTRKLHLFWWLTGNYLFN
jgi:hypothetical protein